MTTYPPEIESPTKFSAYVSNAVSAWQEIQDRLAQFDPQIQNPESYVLRRDRNGTTKLTAYTDQEGKWPMRHAVADILLEAADNGFPMILLFQPRRALQY